MQNDPEKILGNYNEIRGARFLRAPLGDTIALQETNEQREIIAMGVGLVNSKIDEILGSGNQLTRQDLPLPEVEFVKSDPQHPGWAGYFNPYKDKIGIITGNIAEKYGQLKVFLHEYAHRMSHNGRDSDERPTPASPLLKNNNSGFRRHSSLDIRKGREGQLTNDYFVAFNEGTTEQFAIDILPGVHETYNDYRGLFNQVVDDVVAKGLGSNNEHGVHAPWSRERVKKYIYTCFFKGNLQGFTKLLQTTYGEYGITEQQFGLMTHRDDLPSVIASKLADDRPDGPPPSPHEVAAMLQYRLDHKTPDDYVTDVVDPDPSDNPENQSKYGAEYDAHITKYRVTYASREVVGSEVHDVDSFGYRIFQNEEAASVLREIRAELDELLTEARRGNVTATYISERMEEVLFTTHKMSMLSDGFRDFYIYKHSLLDAL